MSRGRLLSGETEKTWQDPSDLVGGVGIAELMVDQTTWFWKKNIMDILMFKNKEY